LLKANSLCAIEERVPPGGAEVAHYHERAYQFFYVLSGEATMEIDNQWMIIDSRQGLSVLPKADYCLLIDTQQDLLFITISVPMAHGDRILVG
jgi:mannose-6-phosphate isomerase-like protein (cupin superfamily)